MKRVVSALYFMSMSGILSACAVPMSDPLTQQITIALGGEIDPGPAEISDSATEALSSSSSEASTVAVNCSITQFCDAPGADGARCVQRGCTFEQATNECVDETTSICGRAFVCPFVFVDGNGRRWRHPCP